MVAAMASVKLVNGQNYHLPPHYEPYLNPRATNLSQQIMTLDDSLSRRSTSTDYNPGSDSAREMSSPPSPAGSESREPHGLSETPTKKNKRKLSEPKKRAEVISKRLRQSSPNACRDDIRQVSGRAKKLTNGHCKRSSSGKPAAKSHSNGTKRDTSSSSSSVSTNDNDCQKDNHILTTGAIPPSFLSPMFAGVPSSTFGYVPGIYLPGRSFPRQSIHASFPSIPLSLQHSYITAAAAGSHTSSSPSAPTPTSSLYSLAVSRLAGSKSQTSASERPQSDQVTLELHATPPVPSPLPSSIPPPSPFSVLHLQPSCLHRPSSSRTVTCNNDDDDASSSRAASPEDLSVGGKLSRKHRKNYKNMTRERRVEANARERTRVHTISAAFDALRRAVPSYSHNQKLSKLAILRIASSYILALARLNDQDYTSTSEHMGKPLTFAECVDMCTNTIQTEGRARRRH